MVWTTGLDKEENFQAFGICVPVQQLESATAGTMLDHLGKLNVYSRASMVRLSGMMCVIGPSCRDPAILEKMMEYGMNVACLDFSHGSHKYHSETLKDVKTAVFNYSKKVGMTCPLGIGMITKGPVIRTGFPLNGCLTEIKVYEGDIIKLTGVINSATKIINDPNLVYIRCDNLHNIIQKGYTILIDRQHITLTCIDCENSFIACRVVSGGLIKSGQRVYFPEISFDVPALTPKDIADIHFGIELGVDMILASQIRNSFDVQEIRNILDLEGKDIMVISQIANQEAVDNIDEIIKASDGIVIARSSLNNEIEGEKVLLAQKLIISNCNKLGKPVICATEMLELMKKSPRPSRAECSDIANAILDGADGILLCNETSKGDYPTECIKTACEFCKQAEASVWQKQLVLDLSNKLFLPVTGVHAIATIAVRISFELLSSAIIIVSSSIKSGQLLAKYRPKCPIILVTRNAKAARQAHMYRGILPLLYKAERASEWLKDINFRIYYGINFGRKKGFIKPGDSLVILRNSKQGSGFLDKMKILYVTKHISHGSGCRC